MQKSKSELWALGKKIFKVFSFSCHGNQTSAWNQILRTTFKGDHQKNIPVKFG
jgi:hypothetical protein